MSLSDRKKAETRVGLDYILFYYIRRRRRRRKKSIKIYGTTYCCCRRSDSPTCRRLARRPRPRPKAARADRPSDAWRGRALQIWSSSNSNRACLAPSPCPRRLPRTNPTMTTALGPLMHPWAATAWGVLWHGATAAWARRCVVSGTWTWRGTDNEVSFSSTTTTMIQLTLHLLNFNNML